MIKNEEFKHPVPVTGSAGFTGMDSLEELKLFFSS